MIVVISYAFRQADRTGGKPDPVTEARIEEEDSEQDRERMRRAALG